jgi:RNA polymerase primary sigma factor
MVERLNKVVHVERQLVQTLGREPTHEEMAAELDCTVKDVRRSCAWRSSRLAREADRRRGGVRARRLRRGRDERVAVRARRRVAAQGERRRRLAALPQREREVIEMRFGLTGERPRTLEEVGRAFNVTRERIRQIENHTLKKLESLPEAQRLRNTG